MRGDLGQLTVGSIPRPRTPRHRSPRRLHCRTAHADKQKGNSRACVKTSAVLKQYWWVTCRKGRFSRRSWVGRPAGSARLSRVVPLRVRFRCRRRSNGTRKSKLLRTCDLQLLVPFPSCAGDSATTGCSDPVNTAAAELRRDLLLNSGHERVVCGWWRRIGQADQLRPVQHTVL